MPDGHVYDGRYHLPDDIELFLKHAHDPNNAQEWAEFYGASLAQYLEVQAWAKANQNFPR